MSSQFDDHSDVLPANAIPLRDAIRRFVPNDLVRAYNRALIDFKSQSRRRNRKPVWPTGTETLESISVSQRRFETEREILRVFYERLASGSLTAIVQTDPPFGSWRPIPASAWADLRIKNLHEGRVLGLGMDLAGVHVIEGSPVDLNKLTARDPSLPSSAGAGHSPQPTTGAPGRPSNMEWILEEFRTRACKGQIEDSAKRQANELWAWFKENHRGKQAPSPKTIYNKLLPLYREARNKQEVLPKIIV